MIKRLLLLFLLAVSYVPLSFAIPDPSKDLRIQKTYESFKGGLLWVQGGSWTSCANTLKDALNHVEDEGLWKEDYEPLLQAIEGEDLALPEERKRADELLTLAALNYISDMNGERLNPRTTAKSIHFKQVSIDETEFLVGYLSAPDSCAWVEDLIPRGSEYRDLKEALARYRQKQAQGGWPQLPKGTKLAKGDQGPLVETLRKQLKAQDIQGTEGSDVFDEGLVHAVKEFQDLHGLEHDGVAGPGTVTALNTPVEERIRSSIIPEILPKIQQNPEAYARKGYVVTYDSGVRIVQRPGSANALGKIRFTIESPFSIYLHGTPAKNLFQKENRAASHGCIRVQDPYKLAQFAFNDSSWTRARIEKETSGSRTDHVKLKRQLPVFITYFTVFEDEQGRMNFVPDEYGQDEKVWEALNKAKRNRGE